MELPNSLQHLTVHRFGKELVIHDEDKRQLHVLNATTEFIWKELLAGKAVMEILQQLIEKYPEANRESLKEDLNRIYCVLESYKLLGDQAE